MKTHSNSRGMVVALQVQAVNEVSALSPFPPRYTSINFTTSQSGERTQSSI